MSPKESGIAKINRNQNLYKVRQWLLMTGSDIIK